MSAFIIAAAQSRSLRGDIRRNIEIHLNYINIAVENRVDLIIFPELSLTGYEPDIAKDNIIEPSDHRLKPLINLSRQHQITILIGAPVESANDKPFIGMIIIGPDGTEVYRKQHLHPGEELYFSSADSSKIITIKDTKIGLAICADITHKSHSQTAAKMGAQIYAAGVLLTPNGYVNDAGLLQKYAKEYEMLVIMANYCGSSGGYESAGKSSIWDATGQLIVSGDSSEPSLLIAEWKNTEWIGRLIKI
ncbi:MAG: carbon-nitrogen hydrolase family protein [Candidatus Zixiibacteriota bacterium]